jgi:WD40 repeat protein
MPLVSMGCSQSKPLVSIALSESGELLATGTRQGQITLWDLSGSPESWKTKDFTNSYVSIADSQSEDPNRRGCASSVTSLTFLKKDGWEMLAAGCQDGSIHMFDISRLKFGTLNAFTDSEVTPVLKGAIGSVTMLSFDSKNSRLYSTGDSRRIELWRVPSKAERITFDLLRTKLDALAKDAAVASDGRPMDDRISNLIQDICKTSDSLTSFEVCKTKR